MKRHFNFIPIIAAALSLALIFIALPQQVKGQPYKGKQTHPLYSLPDKERVAANPELVLADYRPYPVTDENKASIPTLTKAPKGYKPFYISHYGRHGSRWLINPKTYTEPVAFLSKAKEDGKLTSVGEDVLQRLKVVEVAARGRYGELTPLGAKQHREIAGRMYKNFPQVFKKGVTVDARSTVIIRCILSMGAASQRLKELNPQLNITNDASNHDMYYMNYQDDDGFYRNITSNKESAKIETEYRNKIIKTERIANLLLNDSSYFSHYNREYAFKDNPDKRGSYSQLNLFYDIAELAISLPNTEVPVRLFDIIDTEELRQVSLYRNLNSYKYAGWSSTGKLVTPYRQTYLLRNIISTADSVIAACGTSGRISGGATLRFGHDSNLMPLCSLMDIDGAGVFEPDIEKVADVWNVCFYIPKAGNLQFIFYGKPNAPVLIKVLLNEHEATLPVETDQFPYYRWDKVKEFYTKILEKSPTK